ncbi:NAD(P)-dependent oxidoreductase [Fructilactobacillus carniphilus]|uniref:Lactate dehydrogenase n=1 Tax=Fructilactobacillus carniphilus TaxID=2940297 RepID=A0ABY5BZ08_9LACO|nr:NAD(P)-dependent oxidoreductase [Fructilactobacillus carniphilus]USS90331.1 lactate dehydrogenase [Fructilactobacillus carniphilus]
MFKITVYNVREVETPLFEKLNKDDYDLTLVAERMTLDNVDRAEGADAVLITAFDDCDAEVIEKLAGHGVKYIYTRVVGINNIDVKAARNLGIQVANVPNYSPRAVAELSLSLGLTLFRNVSRAAANTHAGDFRLLPTYYANEIHSATVGIIGAGKIGMTEAKLYRALGAQVLAYKRHPEPDNDVVQFTDLDTLLKKSDIVSLHIPYIPGQTGNLIGDEELAKMKDSAILVNTARGQVVDTQAVADAVRSNRIGGYGTDVILDEDAIIGKQFDSLDDLPNPLNVELMKNYPNVLVTPHMGFFTEPAVEDMIRISFENFANTLANGEPLYPINE